ncbi:MAG: ComF family protein [Bacillota bacterium]|nr:ComF family protein [Bacillota bacterium]
MRISRNPLDYLFPARCVVCDEISDLAGERVCSSCKGRIVYIGKSCCMKCGKQLRKEEKEYCEDCERTHHLFVRGMALYDYGSMADSLFRFKYRGRMEYAAFYGRDLFEKKAEWLEAIKPDGLVPVPVHASRMRSRGYNQAQLIARELSRHSGIPVFDHLIKRTRSTKPLKGLTPLERQNNLKRAFKICQNDVKLNTIVIVDDIYTTGSTMDSMAGVLSKVGIYQIYFLTLTIGRGM